MQYEAPEVIEIGEAQEVILGANKGAGEFDMLLPMPELAFEVDDIND